MSQAVLAICGKGSKIVKGLISCDGEIEHLLAFDEFMSTARITADIGLFELAETWTALTSRTKQYKLDSEPSILRCDVLISSDVETQREGNRSDETKLHEIHGR